MQEEKTFSVQQFSRKIFFQALKRWNIKRGNGMTNVSSASFARVSSDPNLSSSQTKLTSIAFLALKKNLLLNAQNAKRS